MAIQNQNLNILVGVLALVKKGKKMLDECQADKPAAKVGEIVEWDGVALLLAWKCFKDVGIKLLLVDTVIQNPTDYVNDVIVAIFGYILGRQGIQDFSQFEHFIIWSTSNNLKHLDYHILLDFCKIKFGFKERNYSNLKQVSNQKISW